MIESSSFSLSSTSSFQIKPIIFVIVQLIIIVITFIVTFTLSEKLGHLERGRNRVVPYISDTIDYSPESCIGTFGISTVAFIEFIIVLIKHIILKNNIIESSTIISSTTLIYNGSHSSDSSNNLKIEKNEKSKKIRLIINRFSTIIGLICGISIHGVSSFQYHNTNIVHDLFAALFFFTGFIYIVTQTFLDDKFSNIPKRISIFRKILIIITCSFIGYIILQFYIDDFAAIFEIISATTILMYISTFLYEFSKITFSIELKNKYTKENINENTALLLAKQ